MREMMKERLQWCLAIWNFCGKIKCNYCIVVSMKCDFDLTEMKFLIALCLVSPWAFPTQNECNVASQKHMPLLLIYCSHSFFPFNLDLHLLKVSSAKTKKFLKALVTSFCRLEIYIINLPTMFAFYLIVIDAFIYQFLFLFMLL